jgi:hypothetical protein
MEGSHSLHGNRTSGLEVFTAVQTKIEVFLQYDTMAIGK